MSALGQKLRTLARLLWQRDFATARRQARLNVRRARIARHAGASFVHHDLGFPAVCHPEWPDSVEQFATRMADDAEYGIIRTWLRPGDCALDVGANLGLYTFACLAAVSPAGRVVAVDADARGVRLLERAAKLLGATQLETEHAAITSHEGAVTFYTRSDQTMTFMQSLRPSDGSDAISVAARTLTTLERRHPSLSRVHFVKLDIEGAEVDAVASAPSEWLTESGPLWQIEINASALSRFDYGPADLLARFSPQHFQCWLVCKQPLEPHAKPFIRPLRAAEAFDDSVYYNLFAVPLGCRWADRRTALRRILPQLQ